MARRRSNAHERWQRLRSARVLVEKGCPYADCVRALQRRYGVSARQAKRYLADGRALQSPEPPPSPRTAVCVSIDQAVLRELRAAARRHRRSVSAEVESALRSHLAASRLR
jgi:hypothetical protein